MQDTFLKQFENKAMEAHKKGNECFKADDFMGFLAGYFEEGYYRMLAHAVSGKEAYREENGKAVTAADMLRFFLKVERHEGSRVTQSLKKMGKLEKIPEIEAVAGRFVDSVSADFIALTNRLFKEDEAVIPVLDRLNEQGGINRLVSEVENILK